MSKPRVSVWYFIDEHGDLYFGKDTVRENALLIAKSGDFGYSILRQKLEATIADIVDEAWRAGREDEVHDRKLKELTDKGLPSPSSG
jgi:hypothetical protein